MNRYLYDDQMILAGSIEWGKFDPIPKNSTTVAPPDLAEGELAQFDGETWGVIYARPEPPPPPVPASITMRQCRLQLLTIGKLADVDTAISMMDEPMKSAAAIEWEYAATVERNAPLISQLGPALGLTEEQLDDLFRQAATL